jgi:hypothetical protein
MTRKGKVFKNCKLFDPSAGREQNKWPIDLKWRENIRYKKIKRIQTQKLLKTKFANSICLKIGVKVVKHLLNFVWSLYWLGIDQQYFIHFDWSICYASQIKNVTNWPSKCHARSKWHRNGVDQYYSMMCTWFKTMHEASGCG